MSVFQTEVPEAPSALASDIVQQEAEKSISFSEPASESATPDSSQSPASSTPITPSPPPPTPPSPPPNYPRDFALFFTSQSHDTSEAMSVEEFDQQVAASAEFLKGIKDGAFVSLGMCPDIVCEDDDDKSMQVGECVCNSDNNASDVLTVRVTD